MVLTTDKQGNPLPKKHSGAFNVKDAVVRPPEFYQDPEGTGIYDITYKPPWPKRFGWPFRMRKIANLIRRNDSVLELGCGFAVQAAIIVDLVPGWSGDYRGWDFCPNALKIGRDGLSPILGERAVLEEVNLDSEEGRQQVNEYLLKADPRPVVVCCETLEHLEQDVELVEAIPSGTMCFFSVPQFWVHSHLRKFPNPQDAQERYGHLLDARYQQYQFYLAYESGWILINGTRR